MKHLLALLAALALALSPVVASAAAPGCEMDRAGTVTMEGMGSPSLTTETPCCPKDKACAAACAIACQAVSALPSVAPTSLAAWKTVRFSAVRLLFAPGVDVRSDTPPPRTTA